MTLPFIDMVRDNVFIIQRTETEFENEFLTLSYDTLRATNEHVSFLREVIIYCIPIIKMNFENDQDKFLETHR